MHYGDRSPALPLGSPERLALAERVNRYRRMPWPFRERHAQVTEVAHAYGVDARTAYRYAKQLREHQCRCPVCGRELP